VGGEKLVTMYHIRYSRKIRKKKKKKTEEE
jgi:hypothetical protein